jgi:signal transduction histidine kinase
MIVGKVLVVDDDANMRETIADNLELSGYEVFQAETGAKALAAVKREFFDVILMDYNLTDATGIEVIRKIRAINTESQILMLTAYASLDTAVKALQESVTDFLAKPVDFEKLKHSIAKALERLKLIQENKRLIADLHKANEELSNLNQMKSKFMSMSSHDLSNSLMTLQVSFEMLASTITPDEDQKKRMDYIDTGIRQIARLIGDLVDWAAIEQGKLRIEPAPFAPGAMVESALVGPQARAARRGIALSAKIEPALPAVVADKRRVSQVLDNLLENAIRHTPKGGRVEVAVERKGQEVAFSVKDTGEGIAAGELDKIFRSFYQGSGHSEGGRLGLGLAIARELVQAHKGRLEVESPGPGRGSTFLFTLPAAPPVSTHLKRLPKE